MIKERRVYDGNNILFDARDVLDKSKNKGKTLVKMVDGKGTFLSAHGTTFWPNHPFQWVDKDEAGFLLGSSGPSFSLATIEDVEDWYSY